MSDNITRAALYIRVSTDDQLGFSPDAQKNALQAYAKKNNMEVAKEHIFQEEGGKSGRNAEKRKRFMEMIGTAKTEPKPFDVILVHKFDRFARNRQDSIVYKAMLKKDCGIRVVSITESIDESDKMSILIESLLEAMAEYYSINLSEEVKKGMTEKAKQGGFQTSPPLGYYMNKKDGKLTVDNEEEEHVKYIFRQFLEYDKSPHQIAKALNQMGVATKRGNTFDGRGVDYILRNPIYIGKVRWTSTEKARRNFNHPDTIVERGEHEPIISDETFNLAADKLLMITRKIKRKQRPLEECSHWLSGLVKCSNCGASLTLATKLKYPSFQCGGYNHAKCNISHSITIAKLENAILRELGSVFENIGDTSYEIKVKRTDNALEEIELLKKQLLKISDKYIRAKEAYLAGIDSLEEYKTNKESLEKQKQNIKSEVSSLKNNQPAISQEVIHQRFCNLIELLTSDCGLQAKQKAVRSIIRRIEYSKPNESLEIYYFDM